VFITAFCVVPEKQQENAMNLRLTSITAITMLAAVAPAFAHHSFAMFDGEKTLAMTGTVKEVEWTNPHSWLRVMVLDKTTGNPAQWAFEMGPPARQLQRGWKPDSLKPGDSVTVRIHPLKDGSRGGQLVDAVLPDGRTVGGAGAPVVQ
jgi:hypothetical protein